MANKNKIINQAQKYISKGQWDRAIKELRKLIAEDPSDVRTLLKLGDVYSKKGDRENATRVYKQVAESYGEQGFFLKAVAVYKQILRHEPRHLEVILKLAELYQHLGLTSDAMSQYQIAAQLHEAEGRPKDSLDTLKRMADLDGENVAARIKVAEAYSRAGALPEAINEFETAAGLLKQQARVDDYVKVAERLVYHAPDRLDVVKDLAKVYLSRGDTKRGLAKLQICFKGNPREPETLSLLGQAFSDLGQPQKAIFVYRELAHVYQDAGRLDEARAIYQRVLELDPTDAEAQSALGVGAVEEPHAPQPSQPMPSGIYPVSAQNVADTHGRLELDAGARPLSMGGMTPLPNLIPSEARLPTEPSNPIPSASGALPEEDEVLVLHESSDSGVSQPEQALRAPPSGETSAAISKILTEADVYTKYGLREKALEHIRKVFDLDPDNVLAYDKMRDLYLEMGESARAQEAIVNVFHIHSRNQNDVEARGSLAQLKEIAPEHPLLSGMSAMDPASDDEGISIDIMTESQDLVERANTSLEPTLPADEDEPLGPAFEFGGDTTGGAPDNTLVADDYIVSASPLEAASPAHALANDLQSAAIPPPVHEKEPAPKPDELPEATFSSVMLLEDQPKEPAAENEVANFLGEIEGFAAGVLDGAAPVTENHAIENTPFPTTGGGEPTPLLDEPFGDNLLPSGDEAMAAFDAFDNEDPTTSYEAPQPFEAQPLAGAAEASFAQGTTEDPITAENELGHAGVASIPETEMPRTDGPTTAHNQVPEDLWQAPAEQPADGGTIDTAPQAIVEPPEPMEDIDDELDEAEFLIEAGVLDEARETIQALLEKCPNHARALNMLKTIDAQEGLTEEEPEQSPEALEPEPSGADANPLVATLEAALNDPSDDTDPDDRYDQGLAFKELGRTQAAIEEFMSAARSPSRAVDSLEMIAHCFLENRDPNSAILVFTRALDRAQGTPAEINLKYEIGAAHEAAEQQEGAIRWFRACYQQDANHRGVADRLRELGAPPLDELDHTETGGTYNPDAEEDPQEPEDKISYL